MVKLTPTGVKINTNWVWTSHNTGGVEFNTGVFAVLRGYNWMLLAHRPIQTKLSEKPEIVFN